MSEPTYRVDLKHDPSEIDGLQWSARIHRIADDSNPYPTQWGGTMEDVFDKAQALVQRVAAGETECPPVYLSEDGEIIDRHEVQR